MAFRRIRSEIVSAASAALTICCLAAAMLVPSTARADAAQVTVVSPGGASQTLALQALAGSEDVVERAYVLRGDEGETTVSVTGFSLSALIDAAGADPYSFSYLEVRRPAGGAVQLSREQALDAGAFADGPPVVHATAAGTAFLRPAAGADDRNAGDSFEAPQGISVVLRKGTALRARAEASTLKTQPGKVVRFEAIVERAGAGEALQFSWTFDDGHSGSGQNVQQKYAKPGSYDVVLGVTSSGDEAGTSAVVRIRVGEPAGGPDRKGGGSNRAEDAPDHGVAEVPTPASAPGRRAASRRRCPLDRARRRRNRRPSPPPSSRSRAPSRSRGPSPSQRASRSAANC